MGIAQGATDRPVKPNWMAAMVSWNRFVLVEKNTGALMDTAFAIAWEMIPLMSPCPSFWRDVALHRCTRLCQCSERLHDFVTQCQVSPPLRLESAVLVREQSSNSGIAVTSMSLLSRV